jgi:pimeloyl-ACP methyl ester carboxylesterase
MKSFSTLTAVASFAGIVSARCCRNLTVSVDISARNGVFDAKALTPQNNIEVTNLILDLTQGGKNFSANQLKGYATVSGKYELAATYCEPDHGAPNVVQLLTHGIGFDRSYWDLSYNNYNYSYVNEAVDEYGFATFAWDRLGIAQSQHGDPVNEIQAYLEVAALKALTDDLRAGSIHGVPKFSKVLHVGHSFGSEHTYLLTAQYPKISDGIALTGFSQNGSFIAQFALGANFVQANTNPALKDYAKGYLADASAIGVQIDFFSPGMFDPKVLALAFATGQPVTVGELLTQGGEIATPNTFAGPVLIVTGERDVPFCGGNCNAAPTGYPNIPSSSKQFLTNAAPFEVIIVPGAGHGLNLEYSHPFTYGSVNNFFIQNGKGPAN